MKALLNPNLTLKFFPDKHLSKCKVQFSSRVCRKCIRWENKKAEWEEANGRRSKFLWPKRSEANAGKKFLTHIKTYLRKNMQMPGKCTKVNRVYTLYLYIRVYVPGGGLMCGSQLLIDLARK